MSLLLLWMIACDSPPAPAGTPAAPAAPAHDHASHDHAAPAPPAAPAHDHAAHGHAAAHGGIQKELDGMHIEGLAMPDGVMFWLTDGDAKPLPLAGITGSAVIKGPEGVASVALAPMGDHLHAQAKLAQGQPATIVVTVTRDGKAQSATFDVAAVGLQSHDHTSLHGGQVGMWGDHHVEYLGRDGEHRVWITDEHRNTLKDGLAVALKDGDGAALPLTPDATGMFFVRAEGAGTRPVMVEVTLGGTSLTAEPDKRFSLGFNAAPPQR